MLEIYPYDAGRGDCLRVRFCGKSGTYRNILIDSGPRGFGHFYASIFQKIQSAGEGVDIQLITHTDEDHLGALLYTIDHGVSVKPDIVVINHPQDLPVDSGGDTHLSVPQADRAVSRLTTQGINLRSGLKGDLIELDGARIKILHPTQEQVEAVYGTTAQDMPLGATGDRGVPLEQLMERPLSYRDASISNRASIIFVLEYAGKRLLFAGDAWSDDILNGVRSYAGEKLPVRFDAVKLPHHGSSGNISEEWPKVFQAERYILCADGRRHPNKQTIAKLLSWYGNVEIVSPRGWWSDGYFSATDVKQFIESKRLQLTLGKGVPMLWQS